MARLLDEVGGCTVVRVDLFAGTAWHYARYRPGHPHVFLKDLVERLRLDGAGRLLDLGCGTGQLTIPLAAHVAEAVGIDPDPGMLAEAEQQAREESIANIIWRRGTAENLANYVGHFKLVTMGRSFHWMDREQVLTALDDVVDVDGSIVIASDGCLVRPTTP